MAQLHDKLMNRIIEGELEASEDINKAIASGEINATRLFRIEHSSLIMANEVSGIKIGDFVLDEATGWNGVVKYLDDVELDILYISEESVVRYSYDYTEDANGDYWELGGNYPLATGTKLYKHELSVPVSISGQNLTLHIVAILNNKTKITNPGMLSMLDIAVSVKLSCYYQGNDLFPQYLNFASGPNLLGMWFLRHGGPISNGYQSSNIASISSEDNVTPL